MLAPCMLLFFFHRNKMGKKSFPTLHNTLFLNNVLAISPLKIKIPSCTAHLITKQIIAYHQGNRNFFWYILELLLSIVQIMNEYILFRNMLLTEIYQ